VPATARAAKTQVRFHALAKTVGQRQIASNVMPQVVFTLMDKAAAPQICVCPTHARPQTPRFAPFRALDLSVHATLVFMTRTEPA